jgi:hypothetical protein
MIDLKSLCETKTESNQRHKAALRSPVSHVDLSALPESRYEVTVYEHMLIRTAIVTYQSQENWRWHWHATVVLLKGNADPLELRFLPKPMLRSLKRYALELLNGVGRLPFLMVEGDWKVEVSKEFSDEEAGLIKAA